ncbi:MAG: FecR domain-containing protein [Marinilabiliaceae bacterium]|nr:FecR domain-containing protein [Marinilabiliaceae bacterium]
MDSEHRKQIINYLVKLQNNSITEEEKKVLVEWSGQHVYYKELLQKVQKADAFQQWKQEIDTVKTQKAWVNIEKAIRKKRGRQIRLTLMRYAAAAVVALLIGTATYFMVYQVQPDSQLVAQTQIKPGTRSAELVLSNGQIVTLGKGDATLKENDGTLINTDSLRIAYQMVSDLASEKSLMNEIRVKRGQEYLLQLADGTIVRINSMSSIKFPVQFSGSTREVEITGEVHFDVEPDAARPFIVHTPMHDVRVLGTVFNISCYEDDETVHTTLVDGKVRVSNITGGIEGVEMIPNQQYIFNKQTMKSELKEVDASVYAAWTTGYFQFEEEALEQVFKKLQRWYNIDVFYVNEQQRTEYFTGRLPRFEQVEVILGMIEKVSDVKFEVDGNTIVIK